MRNPGTHMGVCEDGSFAGSLSGGCIENAVVAEALAALKDNAPRLVRFGAGSPFLDIILPCGGALDVHFQPLSKGSFISDCMTALGSRKPFTIALVDTGLACREGWQAASFSKADQSFAFGHWPVPRLVILGHGASVAALANLAATSGYDVDVLSPDERVLEAVKSVGLSTKRLSKTNDTHLLQSDPWTAFVFLFHDHDWEIALMKAALDSPHFYLGAMGSRRAHEGRCAALLGAGAAEAQVAAIHAPLGLFHSSRDPGTLALSALAQIIERYQASDFEAAYAGG